MKILAINGSPRPNGNTALLLTTVLEEIQKEGIETHIYQLGGTHIRACTACRQCFVHKNKRCIIDSDELNTLVQMMCDADGILLGSPTYFANVSSEMKALIDRAGLVAMANNHLLQRKVGASVVAVRRAGATNTFDALNKFFFINQCIMPGSVYWNMGYGREEGEAANDEEGINTMRILGRNMAWVLKKLHA